MASSLSTMVASKNVWESPNSLHSALKPSIKSANLYISPVVQSCEEKMYQKSLWGLKIYYSVPYFKPKWGGRKILILKPYYFYQLRWFFQMSYSMSLKMCKNFERSSTQNCLKITNFEAFSILSNSWFWPSWNYQVIITLSNTKSISWIHFDIIFHIMV